MLVTKTMKVKWSNRNRRHYEDLGYVFTKICNEFKIKTTDLTVGVHISIKVKCDECGEILDVKWQNYQASIKDDGTYQCKNCARKLNGTRKMIETKLLKSNSLEQWCHENNHQDYLDRFDYEMNNCTPDTINCNTNEKYWFKCPRGLHKSQLRQISVYTRTTDSPMICDACNSLAQCGIDNLGEDFLEKYWSNKNIISAWDIACASPRKVWIKCQEKDYHEDYSISCAHFKDGHRCPYCSNFRGKVHPLDSLGKYLEDNNLLWMWSSKNTRSPFEYSPMTKQKAWWKCSEKKHKDFYRNINNSITCKFRCPVCKFTKGEIRVQNYLLFNNIEYKSQYRIPDCKDKRSLPFDFAILNNDKLISIIEYDGIQHFTPINFSGSESEMLNIFKVTQKRDKIKNDYCNKNGIKIIRIPYTEYNNIENILNEQLNNNEKEAM